MLFLVQSRLQTLHVIMRSVSLQLSMTFSLYLFSICHFVRVNDQDTISMSNLTLLFKFPGRML